MFANQLPRIGVLNGNSGSTGCVRRARRSMPSFYIFSLNIYGFFCFFFLSRYRPVFNLSASFDALSTGNGIWPLFFFL